MITVFTVYLYTINAYNLLCSAHTDVNKMTIENRIEIEKEVYNIANESIRLIQQFVKLSDDNDLLELAIIEIRALSVDSFLLIEKNFLQSDNLTADETQMITNFTHYQIKRILNTIN